MELGRQKKPKLLTIAFFVSISIFMSFPIFFGIRALGDEARLAIDIHALLQEGSLQKFNYKNGQAYLVFVPLLLNILALSYSATNFLSPLVGSFCLFGMVTSLMIIYFKSSGRWIGGISLFYGFFPFAAFIVVITETSHKAFIYTLVFVMLYLIWCFYNNSHDIRHLWLISGGLSAISFFNIYWGIVYTIVFGVAIYLNKNSSPQPNVLYLIPIVISVAIVAYLPTVTKLPIVLYARFNRLFGRSGDAISSIASTGGGISGWPTISFLDFTFSAWFLYTLGIFFIGLITVVAFSISLYRLLHSNNCGPTEYLVLIFIPLFSGILITFIAGNDLPSFRRLVVFPGMLGLLYWNIYLNRKSKSTNGVDLYTIGILITVFVVVTSSFLAIPRMTLDGNNKPYDFYHNESDLSRAEFIIQKEGQICPLNYEQKDQYIASKVYGERLPDPHRLNHTKDNNKIYASVEGISLYC